MHVVESLARGGLERMVCDLATEQAREGHVPTVINLFGGGLLGEELLATGIAVTDIDKRRGSPLAALWRLRRALRRSRPTIVHTHNATANYHVVCAGLGLSGAPIVNTRHGAGAARTDPRERLYRASLVGTARVVAVSEHARNHFVDDRWVAADRICVIPNGIRVERFRGLAQESLRPELGLGPEHHVVGIVGRLNWVKDHEFLLRAWAHVQRDDAAARLLVIGDGELREALAASAARLGVASTVQWLRDRSDVPRLLHTLDVLALSSRTEGYSIALLEGAAAGVPMVATDVGGNREIVADGVTGLVVPHGDEGALSRALLELLNDPPRRARLGSAAAAWATQAAGVDTMQRRYAALYRSLLAGAR